MGRETIQGEMLFFSLSRDHLRFSSFNHEENLLVVNINYLLMTYNFKDKLRYLV